MEERGKEGAFPWPKILAAAVYCGCRSVYCGRVHCGAAVDCRTSHKYGANRALLCDPPKLCTIVYSNNINMFFYIFNNFVKL